MLSWPFLIQRHTAACLHSLNRVMMLMMVYTLVSSARVSLCRVGAGLQDGESPSNWVSVQRVVHIQGFIQGTRISPYDSQQSTEQVREAGLLFCCCLCHLDSSHHISWLRHGDSDPPPLHARILNTPPLYLSVPLCISSSPSSCHSLRHSFQPLTWFRSELASRALRERASEQRPCLHWHTGFKIMGLYLHNILYIGVRAGFYLCTWAVLVCVCMYLYMLVCMFVCMHACMHVCMCVCLRLHYIAYLITACMLVYVYMYIYMHIYIHYVYIYMSVPVYMPVFTALYTHTHI